MIYQFIIFCLVVIILGSAGEAIIRRKFNIEKRGKLARSVNKLQTRLEIALFVLFIIGIWFVMDNIFLYLIGFLTILNLFRAFMYYKYEPEKKHHILFVYELVVLVAVWAVAYWWIFG